MEEYYFLFGLAAVWTVFAVVQDIRKTEVSNWLNFSFVAFGLVYRAFYSLSNSDFGFFLFGVLGFAVFFVLAYGLYYIRAFAGGDAKLLMGYGVILPYSGFGSLISLSLAFVFLLFVVGAIYGIVYSLFLVVRRWGRFKKEFLRRAGWIFKGRYIVLFLVLFGALLLLGSWYFALLVFLLGALLVLFLYLRSVELCMIVKKRASELMEGDWLERDVKVGGRVIRRSVHGLSLSDIRILERVRKKVLIKEGIPFTPAFLVSLTIMVYAFLASRVFDVLAFLP